MAESKTLNTKAESLSSEQLITEHLDIWTTAIEQKSSSGRGSSKKFSLHGIKKLRELILELAVRGKLVPQDLNDEPASVLLERIAAEKAQLVKDKKIKKPKVLPEISDDEIPFDIPNTWVFVRLNELGEWGAGSTPSRSSSELYGGDIPWFKSGELSQDYIYESEETVTELALKKSSLRYNSIGDVLLAMYGATIGKAAILGVRGTTNQAVCACTPFLGFSNIYLLMLLKAYRPRFIGMGAGGAQPNISREKIIATVIALPPLEEQHRIVAKVDELMSLCDALEEQTETSITAHQTLVETLLNALLLPQTAANTASQSDVSLERAAENSLELPVTNSFVKDWQRVAEHFDTLFTTAASIDTLKQTILQLAVMGKLVAQNPNDEPAAKLLKRIAKEKAQLVKNKVYQKSSNLKSRNKSIIYPTGWVGVQTGEVCPSIVPNRDRPKSFSGNIPWVTLPAFPKESLYLDHRKVELALSESEVIQYSARLIPEGSVLMSCVGRFGLTAINRVPVTSNQQVHAFIILDGLLPEFLSIVIKVEGQALECVATSTTIAYLNKTNCESIQFGLPPLEEQHRIVAKVDELMALCDQLKARLSDAKTTQLHLTDAIVEQAL